MIHPELFNGGRISALDAALLKQSQCVKIENGVFRHGDPAVWRIPGWAEYDRPASADAYGLVACRFDNGNHYLLTQCSGNLWRGAVGQTATMVTAGTASGTGQLSVAQYNNRFYIANGVDPIKTLLSDGTVRQTGMTPITTALPTVVTATGTFSEVAGGFYDYWITEVYKSTAANEQANAEGAFYLESSYTADPQTVEIPTTLAARAEITLPTSKVNSIATHWRIYRGGPKTASRDTVFPIGYQIIDDIEITTSSYGTKVYDGTSTSQNTVGSLIASSTNWTNSTGGAVATSDVSATGGGYIKGGSGDSDFRLWGFTFTNLADPINGIMLTLVCSKSASGTQPDMTIDISIDGGSSWSTTQHKWTKHWLSGTTAAATGTFGGQNDLWGFASISQGDLGASKLMVRLRQSRAPANPELRVDYILVSAYYNGSISPDTPYNAVVVETADVQGSVSGAGVPPVASILSVFDGMTVANDVDFPNRLRYSQPDAPEYWPSIYFLNMETEENDTITFHGIVNNRLIVGQTSGIIRVGYLPTETDADFHRGRAWEFVSRAHGVISSKCATVFTGPDGRQLMAFVSHNGLYATDGYTIQPLSEGISWFDDIAPGSGDTTSSVNSLVADSSTHTLWLYLTNGIAYTYHYLTQVWTGPNYITASGTRVNAAIAVRGDIGKIIHYIALGTASADKGKIMVSDTSDYHYSLQAGTHVLQRSGHTVLVIKTRDMHLAGLGNEFQLDSVSIYASDERTNLSRGQPLQVSMTADLYFTNAASITGQALDVVTPLGKMTTVPVGTVNCSAVALEITCDEAGYGPARVNVLLASINPGEGAVDA